MLGAGKPDLQPAGARLTVLTDPDGHPFCLCPAPAAGVPVLQSPHNTGNNNRDALLRDPDGNLVEIVAKAS